MTRMERRPQKIADWIAAGNELPEFAAGQIQTFLESKGIVFGLDGVSVLADGTITTAETDATPQKLRANLDLIDPETLDPERAEQAAARAILRAALAAIRATDVADREPADNAVLAIVALLGVDDDRMEAAGR